MKRTALIFYLIAAALSVRADYETLPVETDEAMGEFIRFESRTWAAELSGEGGRLAANTTWTGEHVILNDVYVPSGVTLTLGPGAKVKFCTGTRIKVEDGGAIVLNGAEGEEVVLSGFAEDTTFAGIVLQSNSASYSDNGYVVADGFAFGKFATVSLSDTTAFVAGGQAIIPVSVSGSRESAFSFDWVAETNGVAFASGSMSWSRVGDGTKNIVVPFDSASFATLGNFTVRASLLRCCNASKPTSIVTLSEFITSDIQTDEAMGDFIRFESRDWTTNFTEVANAEGGRLTANTVWSNEHVIVSSVYIPSGITLTLTADTVVRFCEGTMIKIEDGGKLEIVGADGHDVILRGYEDDTKYTGIVKMSSGTLTDNSYVRVDGFTLGTLANVALNNSSSFRSSGLALIPVTVSGSRDSSFSIDWVAETNGAPYKSGTMLWNRVSDGTKNISINYGAELDGLDKFTIRVAVHRACYANPDSCEVKISDFIVADIQTDEVMGDFIRFESRDWTTNFTEVANAEGGRLTGNTVWSNEHVIVSDVYIPSGVTLTLAADALVRFCEGAMIKIEDGGVLNIVGVEGHDVILRNYDANTTSRGIVKMSSGTYTDNMYVQYPDFRYGSYPDITLHDAGVGRDAGKIFVPITLGGTSRSQSFNVDWETDKGASGTISWSQSSEGTKWIEIPVDAATFGGTETYGIRLTAARGANLAVADAKVTIYEFDHPVTETVSVTEGTEPSNEFAVNGDIREQPIFLNEVEPVRYSGLWQTFDANEAVKLRVLIESDNGVRVLKEAGVDETGEFAFRPEDYPVGHYTLKHEIVDKVGDPLATMSKAFSVVDREDVVMHGGTLTSNEIWKAGMTHVVYALVTVPAVNTLFIEPGAIVKFMTGTGIDLQTGAALFANAIVFTHIDDDTVGGDTLSDGYTVAPPMDAYYLTGNFTFGDDAELRNITQKTALTGTLNGNKMLSKGSTYRVSGTFTIANGAKLTIPAGTVLKMEKQAAIVVNAGGELHARGTRAAPITVTSINDDSFSGKTDGSSSNPQAGDWDEIRNNGGTIELSNVNLLYGGYGQYSNQGDAIVRTTSGTTTLDCCVVAHSNLRLLGRTGGTMNAVNCVLMDGWWGIDGAVGLVNGVIADCLIGSSGGSVTNTVYYNCETYSSSTKVGHCVAYGEVATVQSGMVYADPLFVDPENGDFRIVAGSPCVDAADSSVAPELDFYGQPRITLTEQTNDVPVVQGQLADIGICEVMPRDVTSDIDLQPVSVRAEEKATPGQLIFVKWTVSNVGGVEVDGSWRDTISLVSENGQQVTLGDKITTSHIAVGGEVFCSAYFTVPAMAEGKWRLKVNVNSYHDIFEGSLFANNALTSDRTVEISLPSIDPAQGATDGVINAAIPKVLKLTFAEGEENRMVHLDVPAGVKVTYGFGFMPRGNSASGSVVASDTGVRFRVPEDATDVYVTLESDETTAYALSYASEKIEITSVSPNTLPSSGQVTLTIAGAGFTSESQVELVKGGKAVAPKSVQYVDTATIVSTVDCATLAAGSSYDVRVSNGENSATSVGAVSVAAVKGEGRFWARLVVPDSVRQGRKATCYVEYGNNGTADMLAPIVQVVVDAFDAGLVNGHREYQFVAIGSSAARGILQPGESCRCPFTYLAGAKPKIQLYTSCEKDFHGREWTSSEDYIKAISAAATRVGVRGGDASNFKSVYDLAVRMANGEATGAISGVVCRNGENVKDVLIEVKGDGATVIRTTTDENGWYCVEGLQSATYEVFFGGTEAGEWKVEDGSDVRVDWNLSGKGSLVVYLNELGNDVSVFATSPIEGNVWTPCCVEAGVYVFTGLPDGIYKINAICGNRQGSAVAVANASLEAMAVYVDLEEGVSLSGTIEGVTDSEGTFLVVCNDTDVYIVPLDENGHYELLNVKAGSYDLVVSGLDGEKYAAVEEVEIVPRTDYECDFSPVFSSAAFKAANAKRESRPASKSQLLAVDGTGDVPWWRTTRSVAKEYYDEGMRVFMSSGPILAPDREHNCPHNMAKYYADRASYVQFSGELTAFIAAYGKTDGWKAAAYLSKSVGVIGEALGRAYNPALSKAKKARKYVKVLDKAIAQLMTSGVGIYKGLEELKENAAQADKELENLETLLKTQADATRMAESISRLTVYLDQFMRGKHFHYHNNGGKMWASVYNGLDDAAKGVKLVGKAVSAILSLKEAWDTGYQTGEAIAEVQWGTEKMKELLPQFAKRLEEFKKQAAQFNHYPECCQACFPEEPYYMPIEDERQMQVPQSCDPNEMAGPLGAGDPETERFVKPGEWMTYTVYFENKADATAAAQEVTVTNPLSEWLDWSTFEMGEVAFNNQIDLGLVGKKNGTSEVTMNGTNYAVRTELKLDEKTGVADWYLRIVDPTTETGWPEDVFAGFLPPNDETFCGEGHLTYRVKVREDAPAEARIDNSATIIFDYNDPIETDPAWWNTVYAGGEAAFAATELSVDEGGTMKISVNGGNLDQASSVQVLATYNTAAVADLDLNNVIVDGVEEPKARFPLTLSWAEGEIGEKVVEFPVVVDKTVETDEFLTLQLGGAQGQELGEARVCTVTIHDPAFDALAAKVADGTATKAEKSAWDKLQQNIDAPYVRGLADPADRGKVTGSGCCAEGKKVTLKATANRGYVFAGWRHEDGTPVAKTASLTIADLLSDVTYFAEFVTVEDDAASIGAEVNGMSFAFDESGEPISVATNVMAGVYLEWPVAASALSETTVKVAGLPSGLKFTAKDVVDQKAKSVTIPANTIYGAPTAASKVDKYGDVKPSAVKVTVTTAGKSKAEYVIDTTVDPLPEWAVGTFAGPSYDENATNGIVAVTVATSGKITAKRPVNGKAASFSASYFDSCDGESLWATLTAKVGKEVVTNEMIVTAAESGMGFIESDRFDAWQHNWKNETWKAIGKSFDKREVSYEEHGVKVTLRFSASGTAKVAGEFTDVGGKVVKASGSATLLPIAGEGDETRYLVFVYLAPKGLAPHARCLEVPNML